MPELDFAESFTLYALQCEDKLLEQLSNECERLSSSACANFWLSRADLEGPQPPAHWVERWICSLYTHVMRSKVDARFAGAEYWVQKYEKGRGLGFHFDKDEHAMKESGAMLQPQLSSIVYLTGDRLEQRQAPTVLLQQFFDAQRGCAVPNDPEQSALVFPQRGNFLVFDGGLGHGVLDGVGDSVRMTLLVNWWTHQPQVDEMCRQHKVQIRGSGAHDIVVLRHAGFSLYPAADQMQDEDVDCAAFLVPLSMLPAASADGSDSET